MMKYLLATVLILSLASLVISADICSTEYSNCGDCTADKNCGWCGPTATCYNGTRGGPADSTCYGESWFYAFGQSPNLCPNCTSFNDCKSCLFWGEDCAWCGSGKGCREWGKGTIGCSPVQACPCDVFSTCSDCVKDPGCFWCGGANATCMNSGAACPMPAHTCPCSDNTDCHSCLEDNAQGCAWCETESGGVCQNDAGATCAIALNCNAFCSTMGKSCSSCNELAGCGWCAGNDQCVDVSSGACTGPLQHSCPNCAAHHYCDPCLDEGCVWCESGECRDKSNLDGCFIQHTCDSYCNNMKDCSSCNQANGCGWCEDTKQCVDADKANCMFAHSCAEEKCGFDGGAFVGGMFLGIGLCAIGLGGYIFYRYRMAKKPGYSELH